MSNTQWRNSSPGGTLTDGESPGGRHLPSHLVASLGGRDVRLPPETLRQYALLADGERGAVVGPRGDIAFLCAPRWHDDAVFSALLGGPGVYTVTPADAHHVWGGHYEHGSLIWRSRWVSTRAVIECRDALAFPGDRDRLVLLRRIEAIDGTAVVRVELGCRAGFGSRAMTVGRSGVGAWEGRTGGLYYRWTGVPEGTRLHEGRLCCEISVSEGGHHDLVLEISTTPFTEPSPGPDALWARTEETWRHELPDLSASVAPGDSAHSWAVLRGLTSSDGGMVAAATTGLPERATTGRDYDYRYAWIRDQCYAGQAAAAVGAWGLLDAAVRFVVDRVESDGPRLRPVYTVDGGPVPAEHRLPVIGYPGAPGRAGNHAREQFQLDAFGEALLLLAAAALAGRLEATGRHAVGVLVRAIEKRGGEPDAGIWELENRRWAHSRLTCAAGLRAAATAGLEGAGHRRGTFSAMADRLVADVDGDCLHPSGRWQRSPHDPGVDAALLLPGIRGAVAADDQRFVRTVAAVRADLTDDGYVYRFRHAGHRTLHEAEGAFVLSGFHMAMAELELGRSAEALRWFERNRGALGPPGLFAEEFDVVQRQLRGNLPQAFVHAAALEAAHRLAGAAPDSTGFTARDR